MDEDILNKTSYNVTTSILITLICIVIASKNQPENVGLGGMLIFIVHPLTMILTIVAFLALKRRYSFEGRFWIITLAGMLFNIYFAFFGYKDL